MMAHLTAMPVELDIASITFAVQSASTFHARKSTTVVAATTVEQSCSTVLGNLYNNQHSTYIHSRNNSSSSSMKDKLYINTMHCINVYYIIMSLLLLYVG